MSCDIVIFPNVPIQRPTNCSQPRCQTTAGCRCHEQRPSWQGISIRLDGSDLDLLKDAAAKLGISLDDMAGRILRNALRLRGPHGGGVA